MTAVPHWMKYTIGLIGLVTIAGCGLFGGGSPDMTYYRVLFYNQTARQLIWSGGANTDPQAFISDVASVGVCAQSPDGRSVVVSYNNGGNNADNNGGQPLHLSIVTGLSNVAPTRLGDNGVDLCTRGGAAYSTDSSQLAYIDNAQFTNLNSAKNGLPVGTLHLINMADRSARLTADSITAFDLEAASIFALRASDSGIIIQQWPIPTGTGPLTDPHSIGKPILPDSGCVWIDGQIRAGGATVGTFDYAIVSLVDSCATSTTTSLIHTHLFSIALNAASGDSASALYQHTMSGPAIGVIDPHNVLTVTPDGKFAVVAVLNGTAPGVADLIQVNLSQPSQAPATIQSNAQMARSPLDPTRNTWAASGTNVSSGQTLYAIDLTRPTQAAIAVTDNNRSSVIGSPMWDGIGRRLLFTYSGNNSGLIYLDLKGALTTLVSGEFQGAAIDPQGKIGITIRKDSGDPVAVSIPDGATRTLFSHPAGSQLVPLAILDTP